LIPSSALSRATKQEEATLKDVPDVEALSKWLLDRGLCTDMWGKDSGTKDVSKYWKELEQGESGLELWRADDGKALPVRVTHVLRAKVCSPRSYERGIFLFNTWQQFSDGQRRLRNGLLSEKLSTAEVPLLDHLHEVCERAVTQEEMQCVVEAGFSIGPGGGAVPEYDPLYQCPIRVVEEHFVDYTTEVESSKSFPGLLTLYHLYTVEIICSGLPGFDFNTIEYDKPDKEGLRKLKYVHSWTWLEWPQIQRYLFEGSTLKERKTKGSFRNAVALLHWLSQFDLDLDQWGRDGCCSVQDLFNEVEEEQTQLELWGRDDGVPLLMRVVHVLQLKVLSSDERLSGKFLFHTWTQVRDGKVRPINRLMSKKLSSAQVPFDEPRFIEAAEATVKRQLSYLMDAHFQLHPHRLPEVSELVDSGVKVNSTVFKSHHFDVEESPSFWGMHTMYHLYGMELECEGLPSTNFTSLDMTRHDAPRVNGWKWVVWPETLDVLHARTKGLERRDEAMRKALDAQHRKLEANAATLSRLARNVQCLEDDGIDAINDEGAAALEEVMRLTEELREEMQFLGESLEDCRVMKAGDVGSVAKMLPPSMVSKMASDKITSDAFLEEAQLQRRTRRSRMMSELTSLSCEADQDNADHSEAGQPAGQPTGQRWLDGKAVALALCIAQAVAGSIILARSSSAGRAVGVRAFLCGALSMASLLVL